MLLGDEDFLSQVKITSRNPLTEEENKMESEAEVSYMYGNLEQEVPCLACEIGVTLNTLQDNLPEDVRAEFLHHLSCLLEKVRDNL